MTDERNPFLAALDKGMQEGGYTSREKFIEENPEGVVASTNEHVHGGEQVARHISDVVLFPAKLTAESEKE